MRGKESAVCKVRYAKEGFAVGRNYPIIVKFPENLRAKVEGGFLSVLGDDGASDVNGDFFNKPVGTPIPFKVDGNTMRFEVKFGREQSYCMRLFEKKIPPETEAHKMPRPIAVLHVYALEIYLLSLVPLLGDFHIHSTRSDGRNKPDEVALSCYECGLDFQSIWAEVCRRKIFNVYEFMTYGCGDISIARAVCNYAELRAQGLHYPVIGNSDAHRIEDQGLSYTVVFAKSNSIEDVKAAIIARQSVAVAEFEYMDKTQRDFGRPARFAFGEDRFVRFAYFLFGHYFSEHGKAVAAEGGVLRDIVLGKNETEENAAKLEKFAAVSRKSYSEFRA